MSFTSQLGTALSYLANIELAAPTSSPPPPPPPPPQPVLSGPPLGLSGPPIFGVPWLNRAVLPVPASQSIPPPPLAPIPQPIASQIGPPIRGVPWLFQFSSVPLPVQSIAPAPPGPVVTPTPVGLYAVPIRAPWARPFIAPVPTQNVQPPPPPPQYIPTPVLTGPPIMGVPWLPQLFQPLPFPLSLAPPPPPVVGLPVFVPALAPVVPIFGVPWLSARGPVPFVPPPSPIPTPSPPGRPPPPPPPPLGSTFAGTAKQFLPRVPSDDPRLARHTEIVSEMLNSLMQQGKIVRLANGQWSVFQSVITHSRPPTAADDITVGAQPGTTWLDMTASRVWFCLSAVQGSAIWRGPF